MASVYHVIAHKQAMEEINDLHLARARAGEYFDYSNEQRIPVIVSLHEEDTRTGKRSVIASWSNEPIVGQFYKNRWSESDQDWRAIAIEEFDATDAVLRLPLREIIALEDGTDVNVVAIGHQFVEWDDECAVHIVDSIKKYFDVDALADITRENLKFVRERLDIPVPDQDVPDGERDYPDLERRRNLNRVAAVYSSVAEQGLASKSDRGIEESYGVLPHPLRSALVTIKDYAKRKGIDLNASLADIAQRLTTPVNERIAETLCRAYLLVKPIDSEHEIDAIRNDLKSPGSMSEYTYKLLESLAVSMSAEKEKGVEVRPGFDEELSAVYQLLDQAPWDINPDDGSVVRVVESVNLEA